MIPNIVNINSFDMVYNTPWNFQHTLTFSQRAFNIVFNMYYRFQNTLKFSTCFQYALQISDCTEIFNNLSQHAFNIIFSMHYRFQNTEIFNLLFQHAFNMHYRFQRILKFSTCYFKMFSMHFKHIIHLCYEPCWKLCWKPCQKISECVENHCDATMMWQFENILYIYKVVKIKTDIINKDNSLFWSCMCSWVEILCVVEEKMRLIC